MCLCQTIFKSTDTSTNASVSEVEIIKRGGKNYFKIALFVGFSDRDLIEGVFKVPGFTKVLDDVQPNASIINVDSTVGFGTTGTIISGANSSIDYTSKSINQFFGCTGVGVGIGTAEDLRDNETIFGYENGDLTKRIDLRITGVLSELIPITDIKLVNESENVFVKNIGEKIFNDGDLIPDFVVADLSFISLKIVLPSIKALLQKSRSELLLLVKPQFEVGKDKVGKGGVVRDHFLHAEAIKGVANESKKSGWYPKGLIASPLKGPAGNQEYLLWMDDKNEENNEIEKLLNVLFF